MDLGMIVDVIILIGALVVAITNIWKFFSNSGKGIRKKVDEVNEEKEKEFNEKVDARAREIVTPMLEEKEKELKASFSKLLDKYLPDRLTEHDQETRQRYLSDRQRYLCEIKNEVVDTIQEQLDAVNTHETRMDIFSAILKELLRERIMLIYGRNRTRRELEEHEKIELERAYPLYKSLNGNSYIDDYFARMSTWKVIPDDNKTV